MSENINLRRIIDLVGQAANARRLGVTLGGDGSIFAQTEQEALDELRPYRQALSERLEAAGEDTAPWLRVCEGKYEQAYKAMTALERLWADDPARDELAERILRYGRPGYPPQGAELANARDDLAAAAARLDPTLNVEGESAEAIAERLHERFLAGIVPPVVAGSSVQAYAPHLADLLARLGEQADPAGGEQGEQAGESNTPDQLINMDRAAALVHLTKRGLRHYFDGTHPSGAMMPEPDKKGVGGKPHLWRWRNLRPWMVETFERPDLPERLQNPFRAE